MSTVTIYYYLSQEGQKKSILNQKGGNKQRSFNVDVTKYPQLLKFTTIEENGQIKPIYYYKKYIGLKEKQDVRYYDVEEYIYHTIELEYKELYFDDFLSVENIQEILETLENNEKIMEEYNKKSIEYIKLNNKIREEIEEKVEMNKKLQKEKEEEEIEKIEKEKQNWIYENGSEYLKKLLKNEYDYNPIYAKERAEKELSHIGEVIIDIDDTFTWEKISTPSEEQLNRLLSVKEILPNNKRIQISNITINDEKYGKYEQIGITIRNIYNTGYDAAII